MIGTDQTIFDLSDVKTPKSLSYFVGRGIFYSIAQLQERQTLGAYFIKSTDTQDVINITLDSGLIVKVSNDQMLMMRDGSFKRADSMYVGASLMPLYTSKDGTKYRENTEYNKGANTFRDRQKTRHIKYMTAEYKLGRRLEDTDVVKCKNNNSPLPENITLSTRKAVCRDSTTDLAIELRKAKILLDNNHKIVQISTTSNVPVLLLEGINTQTIAINGVYTRI